MKLPIVPLRICVHLRSSAAKKVFFSSPNLRSSAFICGQKILFFFSESAFICVHLQPKILSIFVNFLSLEDYLGFLARHPVTGKSWYRPRKKQHFF